MTAELPAGLAVLETNTIYTMGECEQCLLVVWRLQPTKAAFDRRDAALVDLAARFPERCAYLEVIESESKPPPGDLRKAAVDVFPRLGKNLACVGACIDGTQVRSAFVRAILAGMTFLMPRFQPAKVFKRVGDMAEWARGFVGKDAELEKKVGAAFAYLRSVPVHSS
ncbi:MAG: hypothetical protein KF773_29045 [Deltaproteobacteria bacterium]|nr:hypothetical protein [Deltaproteobacteria bacterium]MCW5801735.1 hypothetical protein [Deltaproteobacteria bacterium]